MAKLRMIKSGSALSPPDKREITQKMMQSRYIRTVKRKRGKTVSAKTLSVENSICNHASQTESYSPGYGKANKKAVKKARITTEDIPSYDAYSYAGGRKLTAERRKRLLLGKRRGFLLNADSLDGIQYLSTTIRCDPSGKTGQHGNNPEGYAEERVSAAGQRTAYRSVNALRSAGRIRITGMQAQTNQVISQSQKGLSGMLRSVKRAINAMTEAAKSSVAVISIAGIGSTAVLIIVSVVMVLAMTVSSSFGEYNLELSDNDLVNIALSQVGTESGETYCKWYGFDEEVGWCAIFASWCGTEAGLIKKGLMPKFAWVPTGVYWFQSRSQWYSNNYTPSPGDIIFFDWYDYELDDDGEEIGQDGQADHVGIVEKVENGLVYTVEGNTTERGICAEKRYPLGYFEVLGYGVILYPED